MHPVGMPARNFWLAEALLLLGEGYPKTFKELMDTTDWGRFGIGKYEKCADCRPIAAMSRRLPTQPSSIR